MNTNLMINGECIQGNAEYISVINPANEMEVIRVASATIQQVEDTIHAAKHAFSSWKNIADDFVNDAFSKIMLDLRKEKDEIAQLITVEQGKTFAMAKFEVEAGISWIEYLIQLEVPIETIHDSSGKTIKVYNRPLGVIASITPWNWPFMIAIWHIFPALKTKNCVVNKPSEYTPLSTIKLVEIINRHLPKGVCSIVLGAGTIGKVLSEHSDISKVTFTGSTRTGQAILSHSVNTLKSVVLELGGNDVGIVLNDVDVSDIAEKIFNSAFLNAGQTCAALKRLYVHEDIFDELCLALIQIANQQVLGDGMLEATTFGPVQNKMQYDKVHALIHDALKNGGKIITPNRDIPTQGYFIAPTLITDVQEGIAIVDEEQFGPVLPIVKFTDIDDVIQRTNNTYYGLGSSVWSKDLEKAQQIANRMETGTVWINSHADLSPAAVFGGWKHSGLGYSFGLEGLLLFTHKQAIHITG